MTVLPVGHLNEQASRCTQLLNLLQLFFSEHMMDNFGCDYSSSGLDVDSVLSKLRGFFQRVTSDGPKYDTYFLYYSGQTYLTGDWAMSGRSTSVYLIGVNCCLIRNIDFGCDTHTEQVS